MPGPMPTRKVQVTMLVCARCAYEWIPDDPKVLPERCAGCNSQYWQTARGVLPRGPRRRKP